MKEPVIADVIDINSGYMEYVDLRNELFVESKNKVRMASYRPIKAHRAAFLQVLKTHTLKDKNCYIVTSTYGTGKSHWCLILGNLLQLPLDDPDIRLFLELFAAADPDGAEKLRAGRGEGRYLVALCDWGFPGSFEEIILRAVNTALKREAFPEDLQTPYLQASKKLESWQTLAGSSDLRGNLYQMFEQSLVERTPEQTMSLFMKRLQSFERSALETFRRIHEDITTAPFAYDQADLIDVLVHTLASPAFKEQFAGMLVLFDEFGDTMAQGEMNPKAFQQFAQLCASPPPECAKLKFVGTTHKDMQHYAKTYSTMEYRVASDRAETVSLEQTGVEDIVAAILTPRKDDPLWQEKIAPHAESWDAFLAECLRLKVFEEMSEAKIRSTMMEEMYPMHPMATFVLFRLVKHVASNTRSVVTFFSEEVNEEATPGSLAYYSVTTPLGTNKKLNLYTVDLLCDYFASNLRADNLELLDTVRSVLRDYEAALHELHVLPDQEIQDDPLSLRILRVLMVYQIIHFHCTIDALLFGLYCTTPNERNAVESRLRVLISKRIVYYNKETGEYEFKRSGGADLDRLIEDYLRDPMLPAINIALELTKLAGFERKEQYLEAKDYNEPGSEDKRLERRFVRAVDLAENGQTPFGQRTFFEMLDDEIEQGSARRGEFEGIALYVVGETVEELQRARDLCTQNTSERVVVAIPKQPLPFYELLREVEAVQAHLAGKQPSLTAQDRAALDERLHGDGGRHQGLLGLLKTRRNKLIMGKDLVWYGRYGHPLQLTENNAYDVANYVIERLYASGHNLVNHEDINKLHGKNERVHTAALREAVEKLLDPLLPLTIDQNYSMARGEVRYFGRLLLQGNALFLKTTEESKWYCEMELEPSKYAGKFPALAAMVTDLRALQPGAHLRLTDWLQKYRRPPYGQSRAALILFLAYLCRLFGESIYVKPEDSSVGDIPLRTVESLMHLVDGLLPQAILGCRHLRGEEREWLNAVAQLFGPTDSAAQQTYRMMDAYTFMKEWWEGLPSIARVPTIYPSDQYPLTPTFLEIMQRMSARDAHAFLLSELPAGLANGEKITSATIDPLLRQLTQQKQTVNSALVLMEEAITEMVAQLFGLAPRSTASEVQVAITAWYKDLEPVQQDQLAPWHHNTDSQLFIHLVRAIDTIAETFLIRIPDAYSLKAVDQWRVNRLPEYRERLQQAKAEIDAQRAQVVPPEITFAGTYEMGQNGHIHFQPPLLLTAQLASTHAKVYVTEEMDDPRDLAATRMQVNGAEPLEVWESKTLHFVAEDLDDHYSPIQTLVLIKQPVPHREDAPRIVEVPPDEQTPALSPPSEAQDTQEFLQRLQALVALGLERHLVTVDQLAEAFERLLHHPVGAA